MDMFLVLATSIYQVLLEPCCCLMYRKYYPVRSQGAQTRFLISEYSSSTNIFYYAPGITIFNFFVVVKHSTLYIYEKNTLQL